MRSALLAVILLACLIPLDRVSSQAPHDGWLKQSPRDEIRPAFGWIESGGPKQQGVLTISADQREGLSGAWVTNQPVSGGQWYRFSVQRQTDGMQLPRRSAIARILWLDDRGQPVLRPDPTFSSYRPGERPRAEPEFPAENSVDGTDSVDGSWSTLSGTYLVPPDATEARIELHFRWGEPGSSVRWTLPTLEPTDEPARRTVRLATVHYQPREGKTPQDKREQFAPLIAEAAEQDADLVVLPETLTYYGTGRSFADVAEAIPGPSTDYFAQLAKRHDLYIVAGLVERDGHLVYNVAVLIGPDGNVVGKYRKATLPRGEIEQGLTPGDEFPVFSTRFGRVGMMICYDGFFPEVARELANRGAEVIAWPVWGCNPLLASARACENHVYVISSTYTDASSDWIRSAVYGHDGSMLAAAEQFGTVAVAEVDLSRPTYWHSLGDFQAQIQPHRPQVSDPVP